MPGTLSQAASPSPYNFLNSVVAGGDATGVTDSSAAFIAAANKLPRGGIVAIPPGEYIVQGLPIRNGLYWVGAGVGKTGGSTGTYLTLPASPSSHMFVWDGDTTGYGGGVSGVYAHGGLTTTYDCIDLTGASVGSHKFVIEHNIIQGFRRGYSGGADDRSVLIQFNNFWDCVAGVYIANNHPQFTGWNDYRDCTYGIQGLLYDSKVVGQNFAYCTYGVAPIGTSTHCERTQFTGCSFAFCTADGLVVGKHCTITGCMFLTKTGGSVAGIRIIDNSVAITGCQFDTDGGVYSQGAVVFDCDYLGQSIVAASIVGNVFRVEGSDVFYHLSSASRDISSCVISQNNIYESGSLFRRSGNVYGAMFYNVISGNNMRYEGRTLASTLAGTVTFTNGSTSVTGVGTAFTSLRLGDRVRLSTDSDSTAWSRVSAITSDTAMTLSAAYAGTGGSGTGVATRDPIYITNNNTVGNAISNNIIVAYSGAPSRIGYGIGGQLGNSTVIGNYVRRGLGAVDTASSGSAQIANNVSQA